MSVSGRVEIEQRPAAFAADARKPPSGVDHVRMPHEFEQGDVGFVVGKRARVRRIQAVLAAVAFERQGVVAHDKT